MSITVDREGPGRPLEQPDTTWLGLLSPEDISAWKSPDELSALVEECLYAGTVERLFAAANRLALALYRAGDLDAAAELCRAEIALVAGPQAHGASLRMLTYGLQPAVNLIRMEGYTGEVPSALRRLRLLERMAEGQSVELYGLVVDWREHDATSADARRLQAFARNNYIIEAAKILLRRAGRAEWLAECARARAKWPTTLHSGPFHAFEAQSIGGTRWSTDTDPTTAPAVFTSIDALHRAAVNAKPDDRRERAGRLFQQRRQSGFTTDLGKGRFLAVLAEVLACSGAHRAAEVCFEEAYELVYRTDPRTANLVAARWRTTLRGRRNAPDVISVPASDPAELARLLDSVKSELHRRRHREVATARRQEAR